MACMSIFCLFRWIVFHLHFIFNFYVNSSQFLRITSVHLNISIGSIDNFVSGWVDQCSVFAVDETVFHDLMHFFIMRLQLGILLFHSLVHLNLPPGLFYLLSRLFSGLVGKFVAGLNTGSCIELWLGR